MLFVGHKGREQELIDIFEKWGLHASVAGQIIEEPVVKIFFQGEIAAEIPALALSDDTPIYHRELLAKPPAYVESAWKANIDALPDLCKTDPKQVLLALLASPTIASKRWVYRQYDHQVQNGTVLFPGGADAAVIRIYPVASHSEAKVYPSPENYRRGVAATTDCNGRYVYLNPYGGAQLAVAEAARNLSCVGATPIAITDNLNFGSPENPVGYWQLAEACRGIADACRTFSTPVTGGNVSLYNETLDSKGKPQAIYPTPVIGMVGLVDDVTKVCGQGFKHPGDRIYLLGSNAKTTLGASEYLAVCHDVVAGKPPELDSELELKVQAACREGIAQGWLASAHDCAEGGIAIALAESAISGGVSANVDIPNHRGIRLDQLLVGESASRIIVSVAPEHQQAWEQYLQSALAHSWSYIGIVITAQAPFIINVNDQPILSVSLKEITTPWTTAIENYL
jgi:phosphoribosylformylglycinamidine synthase